MQRSGRPPLFDIAPKRPAARRNGRRRPATRLPIRDALAVRRRRHPFDPTLVATHLITVTARLERAMKRAFAAAGITDPDVARLLLVIREHGPVRPIDVVELLGMPRSSVTRLLDRADAAGLVDRRFSDVDRRVTHCHLTPAGDRARRHVERVTRKAARDVLRDEIGALAPPLPLVHRRWRARGSGYGVRRAREVGYAD